MASRNQLLRAMLEKSRNVILESTEMHPELPQALQPRHLLRMCDRIERHLDDWPVSKLHRWIGFMQCAMMANRMLDLDGVKEMFATAKQAYGDPGEDLVDHLDPDQFFELDIGGEG